MYRYMPWSKRPVINPGQTECKPALLQLGPSPITASKGLALTGCCNQATALTSSARSSNRTRARTWATQARNNGRKS